ncbi:MAG: hypothetical protein KJO23_01330, partial [Bacteroidia bacterium]|nr:hypothetical protein [Bacteroidia bacterium]
MTLLLVMDQIAFSQEYTSYSKIAVDIKDPMRMQQLVDLGLAVDHYEMLDNGSIAFYAIEDELETLNEEGIPFNIIIMDFNEFYDQQTLLDAPLVAGMQRSNTVANGFDLGSMGGFYTYAEVEAKLDEMKMDYPNLITTRTSIGTS